MSYRRKGSDDYAVIAAKRKAAMNTVARNLFGTVPASRYRTPYRSYRYSSRKPFFRQKKFSEKRLKTVSDKITIDHDGETKVINSISQGTSSDQRLGHDVIINAISIVGKVYINNATDYSGLHILWFLVLDKKPRGTSGAPLKISDIFNIFDNEPCTAMVREDMTDRYRVIRKGVNWLANKGPNGGGKEEAHINIYLKKRILVKFGGSTTGTIDNIHENALYLVCANSVASTAAVMTVNVRMYFTC